MIQLTSEEKAAAGSGRPGVALQAQTVGEKKGFQQPLQPHQHWPVDIRSINLGETFSYLLRVLDGYSRFLDHWQIREAMREVDVEIGLQRAREKFPGPGPRVISDNGSPFLARDLREFIRLRGMTHVKTSPFHPQSNGKIERWRRSPRPSASVLACRCRSKIADG